MCLVLVCQLAINCSTLAYLAATAQHMFVARIYMCNTIQMVIVAAVAAVVMQLQLCLKFTALTLSICCA